MATETINYTASALVFGTTDLDSLASSSTWLAGRESAVISNASTLYVDMALTGRFKANNTSPTIGQIHVYVGAALNSTPEYPDVFDGTSSAETVTTADIKNSILKLAALITTDATANRIYEFAPVSIASLFGGIMPQRFFVFVTHSMVQALNATATNGGQCWVQGIKYDLA
jgi:hypothetical protein